MLFLYVAFFVTLFLVLDAFYDRVEEVLSILREIRDLMENK